MLIGEQMALTLDVVGDFPAAVPCPIAAATDALATQGGIETRGAIFTRAEVVDFILDLAGYTVDEPLDCGDVGNDGSQGVCDRTCRTHCGRSGAAWMKQWPHTNARNLSI